MFASLSLQTEQVIEEDNMLEAFDIIAQYCTRLIEHAKQLDKPQCVSSLHPNI
jgi:vacuolar protein sorting-associated protein IST1